VLLPLQDEILLISSRSRAASATMSETMHVLADLKILLVPTQTYRQCLC
jgi:hypothetical protein